MPQVGKTPKFLMGDAKESSASSSKGSKGGEEFKEIAT